MIETTSKKEEVIEKLKIYDNPNFKFIPETHKYLYNKEKYISVTQLISRFHKKFDSDFWSKKKSEERGITQEEILKEWKEINEKSTKLGTSVHDYVENFFNRQYQDIPTDLDVVDRINKFNIIYAKHLHKLKPIKFEQRIFSTKLKIAGMTDAIFLNKNDEIILLDWKSNKEFSTDDTKTFSKLLFPFENYYENHLNEYSIQVSLYSLILQEAGIDVKASYLLHLGPESSKIHKALDMKDILKKFLDNYMGELPF